MPPTSSWGVVQVISSGKGVASYNATKKRVEYDYRPTPGPAAEGSQASPAPDLTLDRSGNPIGTGNDNDAGCPSPRRAAPTPRVWARQW